MPKRRLLGGPLALATVTTAAAATAAEPELTADTAAQFYDVRSPSGEALIARRRLVTTLGVSVYDLYDAAARDPNAPEVSFRARLRYDADYGGELGETDVTSFGRVVPGFTRGPVDLMYGYVEGRRFLRGWLGFRLGRQYVTDALGWWSFDGGQVRVTTPYYVAVEAYGGLEQRGGMPLSTPRFERDGVWRGDRSEYPAALWPSFQQSDVAPAYGAALESAGVSWLHARLTYRRVYNTGAATTAPLTYDFAPPPSYGETRISQERIGYAASVSAGDVLGVKAGFAYDLYAARMGNVYASLDAYASRALTLSVDYDFYQPTFDADSIWNFFLAMPMNDLALRASWDPTTKTSIAGSVRGRLFQTATESGADASPAGFAQASVWPSSSASPMGGGTLSVRHRTGSGVAGARGSADLAETGGRYGFDIYGERTIETRYVVSSRAGLWRWEDDLRQDREATSFQYALGAGYKLWPRSLAFAEVEHNMNRLAGHRLRVMLWLTLAVNK